MKRALWVTMALAVLTAGAASAQFAARMRRRCGPTSRCSWPGIQAQPEISKVVLVNLACDASRADHGGAGGRRSPTRWPATC